jgi:hypothetical protein
VTRPAGGLEFVAIASLALPIVVRAAFAVGEVAAGTVSRLQRVA